MSLHGDIFLNIVRDERYVAILGKYGSFKTAFAVRLAYEFYRRGWVDFIVGNFPCVFFSNPDNIPPERRRRVAIILDESGAWMKDKEFDASTAYLRKIDAYLFLPTKNDPPAEANSFYVQRVRDMTAYGLNSLKFAAVLNRKKVRDEYPIEWKNPREIFGVYNTAGVYQSDGGLIQWLKEAFDSQRDENSPEFKAYSYTAPALHVYDGGGGEDLGAERRIASTLTRGANEIADALSLPGNQRGRKKRG